jgi:cytochrome c peroxidase
MSAIDHVARSSLSTRPMSNRVFVVSLLSSLLFVACGSEEHLERDRPGKIAQALDLVVPSNAPKSLKTVAVPKPPNLSEFVRDEAAAIRLGKALFWDMQVGSDGKTACASCHFHAGADARTKNQVNPGSLAGDKGFTLGPNRRLTLADFPLHELSNPDDRNSAVLRDTNDVVSSAGVFNQKFVGLLGLADLTLTSPDEDGFSIGGVNTRRVEPRNTPTVINAVFNNRQFWDGRAQNEFNGVDVWGDRNPNAFVYKRTTTGSLAETRVRIPNASLASQAVGPPLSSFEMSADGRTFQDVGDSLVSSLSMSTSVRLLRDTAKKVLARRPLGTQQIAPDDSVLVPLESTYAELVEKAFRPEWWQSNDIIHIDVNGERKLVRQLLGIKLDPLNLSVDDYSMMQYNFSLFFGLAIQMYEATLVADDTPYDRMREGGPPISDEAIHGVMLFSDTVRVRCINCHLGAEMTSASVSKISVNRIRRREGNIIDFGFNNIAVRPTNEDLAIGGVDPVGQPALRGADGRLRSVAQSPGVLGGHRRRRRRVQDAGHPQRGAHRTVLPQRRGGHAHAGRRVLLARRRLPADPRPRRRDLAARNTEPERRGETGDGRLPPLADRRTRPLRTRAVRSSVALGARRSSRRRVGGDEPRRRQCDRRVHRRSGGGT